jgi:hypothetical protein
MSKQEEAGLILKLYDLRREETIRKARNWYFREFDPESMEDFKKAMFSEYSGYLRMVVTYWDMAAGLVNNGAISSELFTATNGEYLGVFAKIEALLPEIRRIYSPQFAANLEKLIDSIPEGRRQIAEVRERMNAMRAEYTRKSAGAGD